MSHKKFGPDRFSRFDVYWIQTKKQTNKLNLYIEIVLKWTCRSPSKLVLCWGGGVLSVPDKQWFEQNVSEYLRCQGNRLYSGTSLSLCLPYQIKHSYWFKHSYTVRPENCGIVKRHLSKNKMFLMLSQSKWCYIGLFTLHHVPWTVQSHKLSLILDFLFSSFLGLTE